MTSSAILLRLRRFPTAWNTFWFRSAPPHALALFRIALGGFLLFTFALQIPHVRLLYANEGILLPLVDPLTPLGIFLTPPPFWAAAIVFGTFLLALFLFALGAATRVSGTVAFLLYVYYWFLTIFQFGGSYDRLFLFSLLVLAPSGCGNTWSLDMRLRRGAWTAWEPVCILPQRLLAAQVTATYLGVGWQKLWLPAWQDGTALTYGFVGRWATAPALALARLNWPLWPVYDAGVWMVKAFEITMPFGLWIPRVRRWYMLLGALFHTAIAVLLAIWWFLALIPAYIVFFEPEEVRDALERRFGRAGRRS